MSLGREACIPQSFVHHDRDSEQSPHQFERWASEKFDALYFIERRTGDVREADPRQTWKATTDRKMYDFGYTTYEK
ncbi:MAG: hypothetical protein NPIRA02_14520 [Nitrospirales bacterium]|nr:MAG: hypothetical protein NPIRA02_14520 [Nitrospirales bacterium]